MASNREARGAKDPVWKRSRSPCLEDMCFTFDSGITGSQHAPKRTRFTAERRKEVASVRKMGACLRCRLLKAPCSGGRPCNNCERMANGAPMSVYQWMDCVTLALQELNIFEMDVVNLEDKAGIKNIPIETILPGSINLDFETLVPWSLGGLTKDFSNWVQQDQGINEISKTGVLSSPRFQQLLASTIGEELSHSLTLLVCITSLIHNMGQAKSYMRFSSIDLRLVRAQAAKHVLLHLEKKLKPGALERASNSREQLEGLFMLVFGTIIATGYFQEWKNPGIQWDDTTAKMKDSQEQLVRILAHYLILIMERLVLLSPGTEKRHLIENAPSQWNRKPAFRWAASKSFSLRKKSCSRVEDESSKSCVKHNKSPDILGELMGTESYPCTKASEPPDIQTPYFRVDEGIWTFIDGTMPLSKAIEAPYFSNNNGVWIFNDNAEVPCARASNSPSPRPDGRVWEFDDRTQALEFAGLFRAKSPSAGTSSLSSLSSNSPRFPGSEELMNTDMFFPGLNDPWIDSTELTSLPCCSDKLSEGRSSLTCPKAGCGLRLVPPLSCPCGYEPDAEEAIFDCIDWDGVLKDDPPADPPPDEDIVPICHQAESYPCERVQSEVRERMGALMV